MISGRGYALDTETHAGDRLVCKGDSASLGTGQDGRRSIGRVETVCTPCSPAKSETNNDLTSSVLLNTIQMPMRSGACPCGFNRYPAGGRLLHSDSRRTTSSPVEFQFGLSRFLAEAGLVFAGLSPDERLVELSNCGSPWYIGVVYHRNSGRVPSGHTRFSPF